MNVLVLNCGSSSVKFQLIATDLDRISHDSDERLAHGIIERIGGAAIITFTTEGAAPQRSAAPVRDTRAAVDLILRWIVSDDSGIADVNSFADVHAVGHRVVHGGEQFSKSVLITDDVLRGIEDGIELAPLHNPANIAGITAARTSLGLGVPQVAVFDTAFHQTLPEHAFLYALPYRFYGQHGVRRYGFHGTSHRYVAHRYRELTGRSREATKLVTLHLGNGASACAIVGGASRDTSMGFTPLEGLVMGTRSGDLDPAIVDFVSAKEGLSLHEIDS